MTYAITRSAVYTRGGFIDSENKEWSREALKGGYGADYASTWQGQRDADLDLDKVLKHATLTRSRTELPDMFWGKSGLIILSGAYHDLIERLDPGIHQMWPFEVRRARKGPFPGRWFGLNVRARAKTIVEEGSVVSVRPPSELLGLPRRVSLQEAKFLACVDESKRGPHHLWWDQGLWAAAPTLLCSDNFHDAVQAAGLKSITMKKCKVMPTKA